MVVAKRAALLLPAAEMTATDEQKRHLTYVIAPKVPAPRGSQRH